MLKYSFISVADILVEVNNLLDGVLADVCEKSVDSAVMTTAKSGEEGMNSIEPALRASIVGSVARSAVSNGLSFNRSFFRSLPYMKSSCPKCKWDEIEEDQTVIFRYPPEPSFFRYPLLLSNARMNSGKRAAMLNIEAEGEKHVLDLSM